MDRHAVRKEAGLSLLEVTVVLATVVLLAGMMVPTVDRFIRDSRLAIAMNDVRTIAGCIVDFYLDTGHYPVTRDSIGGGPGHDFFDLLASGGEVPVLDEKRRVAVMGWASQNIDFMENHLIYNRPNYRLKVTGVRPGWDGPYAMNYNNSDPWGNRYMVNVICFVHSGTEPLRSEGAARGRGYQDSAGATGRSPAHAVFVLSAGPDGVIQTPFEQPVTEARLYGDDIGMRLR